MSEFKPDFDEADVIIGKTEATQSSSSVEVEVPFEEADVENVGIEQASVKDILTEEVSSKTAQSISVICPQTFSLLKSCN